MQAEQHFDELRNNLQIRLDFLFGWGVFFTGLLRCTEVVGFIYTVFDHAQRLQKIKAQFGSHSSKMLFGTFHVSNQSKLIHDSVGSSPYSDKKYKDVILVF